jgi:hypothetical protein
MAHQTRQHRGCAPRVRTAARRWHPGRPSVVLTVVGRVMGRLYRKLTERYHAVEAAGLKVHAEGIAG